ARRIRRDRTDRGRDRGRRNSGRRGRGRLHRRSRGAHGLRRGRARRLGGGRRPGLAHASGFLRRDTRPAAWGRTRCDGAVPRGNEAQRQGLRRSTATAKPPRGGSRVNVSVRTVELHLAVPFAISRATHTTKKVVLVELREDDRVSRGEGVPDAFFGETPESVERHIRSAIEVLSEDPFDLEA